MMGPDQNAYACRMLSIVLDLSPGVTSRVAAGCPGEQPSLAAPRPIGLPVFHLHSRA